MFEAGRTDEMGQQEEKADAVAIEVLFPFLSCFPIIRAMQVTLFINSASFDVAAFRY